MINFAIRKKGLLMICLVLATWEILGRIGFLNPIILPYPSSIALAAIELIRSGRLITDTFASISRAVIGFLIGSLFGISLAFLISIIKSIKPLVLPIIEILRPIPPPAWIPIAILWFGLGNPSAFFLVALGSFFPTFTSSLSGIDNLSKNHKVLTRLFGLTKLQQLIHIYIPGSLPSIFTGLKIGIGISWMILVTAELVGADVGLGYLIQINRLILRTDMIILGMIIIGLIGFFLNRVITYGELKLLRWKNYDS